MFEKFGECDTVDELIHAAAGFLAEGDFKSLRELAEENGLDGEDTEDYIAGDIPELASAFSAALGKLELEEKEIEKKGIIERMPLLTILHMAKGMCTDQDMAAAVLGKGKRIEKIYGLMREGAKKHKEGGTGISCGTDHELCNIIRAYYTEGDKKAAEVIENLYK